MEARVTASRKSKLEAKVRHDLLPLSGRLDRYERLVVTSRIKDCESALEALRRRQEGATFDPDRADLYTLASLNDLAGVRVLTFPRSRWIEADHELRSRFSSWTSDPKPGTKAARKSWHSNIMAIVREAPGFAANSRLYRC